MQLHLNPIIHNTALCSTGDIRPFACFKGGLRTPQNLRRRTEITPSKHSDTRIKPLASANGHGRYISVTPERTLASVGGCALNIAVKFLAVSLPQPPCNGRFNSFGGFRSETATWIRQCLKSPLGLLEISRYNSFSRRIRWAWL